MITSLEIKIFFLTLFGLLFATPGGPSFLNTIRINL